LKNSLSVDFESWVHRDELKDAEQRRLLDRNFTVESAKRILDLFAQHHVLTTFFVVGEIFDWHPEIVHAIKRQGHEIGYHTHTHARLYTREKLVEELQKSRRFIDEFGPKGFRATRIFLRREFLRTLSDYGFTYDSSTYGPYGIRQEIDGVLEIPVSTYRPVGGSQLVFPRTLSYTLSIGELPVGSGLFLGLIGTRVSHFMARFNALGHPAVMFVHPWQLYDSPARISPRNLAMIPYLTNRFAAVDELLRKYKFATMLDLSNGR
jgi:peptidoglycan/xylan/chitin deacetylase (PgdA/CDA1 family)